MRRVGPLVAVGGISGRPGCGLATRRLEGEPIRAIGTASRTFVEPSQRVALAALEAMRAELDSADLAGDRGLTFGPVEELRKPDGTFPGEGETQLPPNHPAFWMDLPRRDGGQRERMPTILLSIDFVGRAKDGRAVEVAVRSRGAETLVTAHVGRAGDGEFSRHLFDKIADRLAHPASPVGSREEAETFRAFFGGRATREQTQNLRKVDARQG